jgi:hypothetical protein
MEYSETEKVLLCAFDKYTDIVMACAEKEFNIVILPYLKKYNLEFMAGNGTFSITYTDKTPKSFINKYFMSGYRNMGGWVNVDKLPNKIKNVLFMEIPGFRGNDLGSLMPDYISE